MNKNQKQVLQFQLKNEEAALKKLQKVYKSALNDINGNIAALMGRKDTENLQSIIYQVNYQKALKSQINAILDDMNAKQYTTISDYLSGCYEDGFIGAMYDIHKQGIPIITPIDQKQAMLALTNKSKLSKSLYDSVSEPLTKLKHNIQRNISRGIATGSSYADITRMISKEMVGDYTKFNGGAIAIANRIARTEGHRIQNQGAMDAQHKAQDNGAKIVKQWDATLDGSTRPEHAQADGQIRELDEPFDVGGEKLDAPGIGGSAGNVINCRCACLQRARWALDEDELKTLEERAEYFGLDKTEDFEEFKEKYINAAEIEEELDEAQKELEEITKLQNAAKEAEDEFNAIDNKTYSGIWKDDVSLSDYESKMDSIPKKKQWYEDQLKILDANDPKYALYQKYLKDLAEFESEGSKYLDAKSKYLEAKKALNAATGSNSSTFAPDVYSEASKNAAKNFNDRNVADKFHRQYLDSKWDDLSDAEKYSVWEYTQNSNPMNKSLSGYHETWNRSDFKGLGNTKWGYEDKYRSIPSNFAKYGKNGDISYHKPITDLTNAIDKMELQDNVYLVRGSDKGGLAGLLEGDILSFNDAKKLVDNGDIDALKAITEGQPFEFHSFMSTGIASGTGFSGDVKYKIYAPKGTHGIYAEPQSYFGKTISGAQLYKTGQSYNYVGREAEVILQRGTTYRITKIEKTGYSNYTVEMEVIDQPKYFKYGDEETFNAGATRHTD